MTIVRGVLAVRDVFSIIAAALVVGAVASTTSASASIRLLGRVSTGGRVTLSAADGRKVLVLRAGVYRLAINDRARRGNFHLEGSSPVQLNRKTGMHFTGYVTWKLSLRSGSYRYFSDSNPARRGLLRVR